MSEPATPPSPEERPHRSLITVSRREALRLGQLLRGELVGGIMIMVAAVLGFIAANSPASSLYFAVKDFTLGPESLHLNLSVGAWASDGLLAIFFFLVGLELKREVTHGALSTLSTAIVPVAAAVGGVAVPAVIYFALNAGQATAQGWAIPTATDIAFAVAVLGLLAPRVPLALRIFLLTLAVVDDLIAILIIAFVLTSGVQLLWLAVAVVPLALFAFLAHKYAWWFASRPAGAWLVLLPLGVAVWALVHASGVHATIAGVLLAAFVPVSSPPAPETVLARSHPADTNDDGRIDLAERLGYRFGPLSSGLAIPLFAFFAAGVALGGDTAGGGVHAFIADPVALGVIVGLVLGKPIGIVGTTLLLTRCTKATLDPAIKMRELVGVGCLAGVGFTVALLVAELSFADAGHADTARLAVMIGSVISVAVSALFLVRRRPVLAVERVAS